MTKYNADTAENMLRVTLLEPRTAGKTIDVEHEKVVIKCLKMVIPAVHILRRCNVLRIGRDAQD